MRKRVGATSGPEFRLAASTVRAVDVRYLQRRSAAGRKDPLVQMGVDEIYFLAGRESCDHWDHFDSADPKVAWWVMCPRLRLRATQCEPNTA
jgi:hypothetical protein